MYDVDVNMAVIQNIDFYLEWFARNREKLL